MCVSILWRVFRKNFETIPNCTSEIYRSIMNFLKVSKSIITFTSGSFSFLIGAVYFVVAFLPFTWLGFNFFSSLSFRIASRFLLTSLWFFFSRYFSSYRIKELFSWLTKNLRIETRSPTESSTRPDWLKKYNIS